MPKDGSKDRPINARLPFTAVKPLLFRPQLVSYHAFDLFSIPKTTDFA